MRALAKRVNQLYPELIEAGGFDSALQMALRDIGSAHAAIRRNVNIGVVCVRVEGYNRRCQAYIVEQERLFVFDLWKQDFILVGATAGSVMEVARRVYKWLGTRCSAADVVARLERVSVRDDGLVYSAREEVDQAWSRMSCPNDSLTAFMREASGREKLRQLFPYGGEFSFGFSRCTRYPFTEDIPVVQPSRPGQFMVLDAPFGKVLGRGDAAEAANLVEALLPRNCGPAVSGTREELGPLDD